MRKKGVADDVIPARADAAEQLLAKLLRDVARHAGRTLRDETETRLRVEVRKTLAVFQVDVKIDGRWTTWSPGRVGEVSLGRARHDASVIRETEGYAFESREALLEALGLKKKEEAPRSAGAAPSVMECYRIKMEEERAAGTLSESADERYGAALRACSPKFYNLSITLVTPNELKQVVTAFRRKFSASYSRNLMSALDLAYEHAADKGYVPTNLSEPLKRLDYDVPTNRKSKRKRPGGTGEHPGYRERQNLEWHQLAALWHWLSDPRCPLTPTQVKLYKVMLLTGERIDTLCQSRWDEVGEDNWWIILPPRRKMALTKPDKTPALFIYVTPLLRSVIGAPDGRSDYIFPSETDPAKPYPQGSLPLFKVLRVRDALKAGVTLPPFRSPVTVPSLLSQSMDKATAKRERGYLRLYGDFLIPNEVPYVCHHEAGRHTVATLAQELLIPGLYVSMMLGHATEKALEGRPILHHSAFVGLAQTKPLEMPRALVRQADALATAGKTAREHYIHIRQHLRGIQAAWILWTHGFCREVLGDVPDDIEAAAQDISGTDDKILSELKERFSGNLEAALEHVVAGHYQPTLHVAKGRE